MVMISGALPDIGGSRPDCADVRPIGIKGRTDPDGWAVELN
jgi:hypothetical protein